MLDVSARIMVGAEVVITHHVTLDRAGVVTEDVLPREKELQQPRYPHCPSQCGAATNPPDSPAQPVSLGAAHLSAADPRIRSRSSWQPPGMRGFG